MMKRKYSKLEQFEAQEVLNAHAEAEAAGIAYSRDERKIEDAGWDHYPPTPQQVRKAREIMEAPHA